jgi:hypothetical protein
MIFGQPSITDPSWLDLRAIQAATGAARRRIEILEAAVTVLQNTSTIASNTASVVTALRAQAAALATAVATLQALVGDDTADYTAALAISQYSPVWLSASGQVSPVDLSNPNAIFGVIGVATVTAATGATVKVQRSGVLVVAGVSFTPGGPVYAGIDGVLTQRPDYTNIALPIGVAAGANAVAIAPGWPALQRAGVYSTHEQFLPITYNLIRPVIDAVQALEMADQIVYAVVDTVLFTYDRLCVVNAGSGNVVVTLPSGFLPGLLTTEITVHRLDSGSATGPGFTVTVVPTSGETIGGQSSFLLENNDSVTLLAAGGNGWIVA